jgi:hypothetical protein
MDCADNGFGIELEQWLSAPVPFAGSVLTHPLVHYGVTGSITHFNNFKSMVCWSVGGQCVGRSVVVSVPVGRSGSAAFQSRAMLRSFCLADLSSVLVPSVQACGSAARTLERGLSMKCRRRPLLGTKPVFPSFPCACPP